MAMATAMAWSAVAAVIAGFAAAVLAEAVPAAVPVVREAVLAREDGTRGREPKLPQP
jgi:hypothetical protein